MARTLADLAHERGAARIRINWRREPIRPRIGMMYSMRTRPSASVVICSSEPFWPASACCTTADVLGGMSKVPRSYGSWVSPSRVCRITSGRETVSSYPSRRICSISIASCSSPRPRTSTSPWTRSSDLDGNVAEHFAVEPRLDLARGHVDSVAPGHRPESTPTSSAAWARPRPAAAAVAGRRMVTVSPMVTSGSPVPTRCRRARPR